MQLKHIETKNWLGLAALRLPLGGPVHLIAGHNATGKTALRDAIAFAIYGSCARVALKRDYAALLTDGAKDGHVQIDTDQGGQRRAIKSGRPQGDLADVSGAEALPYALGMECFSALKVSDRRRRLARVVGVEVTAERVQERLQARGLDEPLVLDLIGAWQNGGFDNAYKYAKERASRARGAWEAHTGEKYGSKKAAQWQPPAVEAVDEHAIVEAENKINELYEYTGRLRERIALGQQANAEQAEYQKLTRRHPRETLQSLEQTLAELQTRAREAQDAHNQAQAALEALKERAREMLCPACNANLRAKDGRLEPADNAPVGAEEWQAAEHAAQETVKAYAVAADDLNKTHEAVNEARRNVERLEALEASEAEAEDIDTLSAERDQWLAEIETWRERARSLQAAQRQAQHQAQAVKHASQAHYDAAAYQAGADAVGPDGVPAELLAAALDPVNERLRVSAERTGWPQAALGSDMGITAGGRPYGLLSESERWRVDAALHEALSYLAGLRCLVLDGMDVLDHPSRSECLEWLNTLAETGEQASVLVLATLKQPPQGVSAALPQITVHWLEQGGVRDVEAA